MNEHTYPDSTNPRTLRMHPDEAMGDYVTLTSGPASQTTSPRTIDWFSAVVPAAEPDQPPTPAYTCPVCGAPQPIAGATCGACVDRLAEYDRAAAEGRLVISPVGIVEDTCNYCGKEHEGWCCPDCERRHHEWERAKQAGRLVLLPMAIGTEVWTITGLGAGVDHVDFYEVGEGKIQWFATAMGDEFAMDDEGKTWWRTDEAAWAEVERRRGL